MPLAARGSSADIQQLDAMAEQLTANQVAFLETAIDDAKRDLDAALPALNSAVSALNALSKNDIVEIKGFAKPPPLVQKVMECVCILLGAKTDWDAAKKVLADTQFMQRLINYDKDNIDPAIVEKIRVYTGDPNFEPEVVGKASKAAKGLCQWVRAMEVYDRVAKVVAPKAGLLPLLRHCEQSGAAPAWVGAAQRTARRAAPLVRLR